MVGADARLRLNEADPVDVPEALAVALLDSRPPLNLLVDMTQVAHAHRRTELVHLGVAAHVLDVLGARDAEILPLVEHGVEGWVAEAHRAALNGVEDLRGVEGEHRGVAEGGCGDAVPAHPEGVCRVVDDPKAVFVGDPLDGVHVAEVAVDVHGDDCAGARGDQVFY